MALLHVPANVEYRDSRTSDQHWRARYSYLKIIRLLQAYSIRCFLSLPDSSLRAETLMTSVTFDFHVEFSS